VPFSIESKQKVDQSSSKKKSCLPPSASPLKWVVVQLSPLGEREKNPQQLIQVIQRFLGKPVEVFIPAVSEEARTESHTSFYMEGYIFIEYRDGINFMKLQDIPYFKNVICNYGRKGGIQYSLLDDEALSPMRVGMKVMKTRPIDVDDQVRVIKGQYKNLRGTVSLVRIDGEAILVNIKLASKPLIVEFPASYLEKLKPK
jgi:transcription antitermination factor NusG